MTLSSLGVNGQVALVTGTGTGLGRATAIALAQSGADVAVTELPARMDGAESTAREIRQAGRRALTIPLDVTDVSTIEAVVDATLAEFGRLDILVNNAGVNIPQLAVDVTEEAWDRVMAVDLKGVFFTAQAAARKAFIPQRSGAIVNIASQMGVVGYVYRSAYCAAKAGVVNLTRVLSFEWATYGVRVNAVGPTFIDTPLTRPMFEDAAFREDVMSRIPLGRLGTPEDVAAAVVYLSSPAASMVTGHTLLVDGGWTAV
jgi:2-deoxy-D-gluconate 3-dehydrogenase